MDSARTRVSAIVPVYNRQRFLREAVLSLIRTGYPCLEVIIVDDGSTDESFAVAQALSREYLGVVRLHHHPDRQNRGGGPSRNLGVLRATGEYVCFLDSDDFVYPNRFDACVPMLDGHGDVDGVYEWTQTIFEQDGQARRGTVRPLVSFECDDPDDVLSTLLRGGREWSTNAILLRRRCVIRTGGFPALRRCADLALWLKIAASSRLVLGSRAPVAVYRMHGANLSSDESPVDAFCDALRAHEHAYRWSVRHGVSENKVRLLEGALLAKLYFCCGVGRKRGAFRPVLESLLRVSWACPAALRSRQYWANLALVTLRRRLRGQGIGERLDASE